MVWVGNLLKSKCSWVEMRGSKRVGMRDWKDGLKRCRREGIGRCFGPLVFGCLILFFIERGW